MKALAKLTQRSAGFTLVEVLVVTVVVGILSSVGGITMGGYAAESRDASRIQTLKDTLKALQISDSTDELGNEAYLYTTLAFELAMSEADLNLSDRSFENICYFVGMAAGSTASPKDNEFVIATWGETTSTFDEFNPGVLAMGTPQAVSNIIRAGGMQEEYFHCDKPENYDLLQSAFQGDYAP